MSSISFSNRTLALVIACIFCGTAYAASAQSEPARQPVSKAPAKVTLSNLSQTYDGAPKRAGATTDPGGLTVVFTYNGSASAPTKAGSYTVVGTVRNANYEGSATGVMIIAKAPQRIAFKALAARTYGSRPFVLSSTVSSGLTAAYESSNAAVATISGNKVLIAGAGTTEITVSQAGDDNYLPAEPVKQVLTVNKAKAKITLANLDQPYDGAPKAAGAKTDPKDLKVTFTYNGSDSAPSRAGSYTVVGTIQDANYEGSATSTLTIAKAKQRITFDAPLTATYGDADFFPGGAASSGLPVLYTSSNPKVATIVENRIHIVGAGSSTITAAQPGDDNYLPAKQVKQVLTVNKALAKVFFTSLDQTYDGAPKPAGARTEPEGLGVALTYEGKAAAPAKPGAYTVNARIRNANYEGNAAATLTIAKAPQTITFDAPASRTYGDGPFALSSTVSSGLTATYGSSNPAVATVSGSKVRIAGAGTTEITAFQAGDDNYLPAEPVKQVLTVKKAKARVTLANLDQTYDGAPKPAGARTNPKGLTVTFTYDNNAAAPTNAGTYTVVGTVQDANYEGSAEGSMTVAKAPQSITFAAPGARVFGDKPFHLVATLSSGLTATYESSNAAVAAISGSEVRITGAGTAEITAYQGGDNNYLPAKPAKQVLTVHRAPQSITFDAPAARTYGDADFSPEAATSSGIPLFYTSSNPSVATVVENRIHIVGIGSSTIVAEQPGDNNYLPAKPVKQVLTVTRTKAKVTLRDLDQTYDGVPKSAVAETDPKGLTVTLTYDGNAVAPTNAGSYTVVGTVQNPNYEGSASATLTIAQASQSITFAAPEARVYGDRPYGLFAAPSSGLTATYGISDASVATISGNEVRIVSAGTATITAYQAGNSNYRPAEPVEQVLIVRDVPHHIAVLPLVNMSGKQAPLKDIRQALIQQVLASGATVLGEEDLERFMAAHRLRYTGGVDTSTAKALKEEAGVDGVLITSLERYEEAEFPAIAMSSRLVSIEITPPRILWMESSNMSGNESPGLLGLGLVRDMGLLQKKAIQRIGASFGEFFTGRAAKGNNREKRRFFPKLEYHSRFIVPGKNYRIAVAPFFNVTEASLADEIMALHFTRQLVKTGAFDVTDPGVIREKLLKARVIMREGVSASEEDILFYNVDTDLILTGKVLNYDDAAPGVEFNVMVFDRMSKKAVWSSWSSNRGDDGVFFFDRGSVNTAGALATKMTRAVVQDLMSLGAIKDPRQLQGNTAGSGAWNQMNVPERERGR